MLLDQSPYVLSTLMLAFKCTIAILPRRIDG